MMSKKKILKLLHIMFAATIMVATIQLPISAEESIDVTEQVESTTDVVEETETAQEDVQEEPQEEVKEPEVIEDVVISEEQTAENRKVRNTDGEIPFAVFAGQDMSEENNVEFMVDEFVTLSQPLTVTGEFEDSVIINEQKIIVTLQQGLQFTSLSGMKKVGNGWEFDNDLLPPENQGNFVSAIFYPADMVNNAVTGAGRVEYILSPGTTGTEIEFLIAGNRSMLAATETQPHIMEDMIEVKQEQVVGGEVEVVEKETLEHIKVSGASRVLIYRGLSSGTIISEGTEIAIPFSNRAFRANSGSNGTQSYSLYTKEIEVTHTIPKELGIIEVVANSEFAEGDFSYKIDRASSTTYDKVTIIGKNMTGRNADFYSLRLLPNEQIEVGKSYSITPTGTFIPAWTDEEYPLVGTYMNLVGAQKFENQLFATTPVNNGIPYVPMTTSSTIGNNQGGALLGGFLIQNKFGETVNNQRITLSFPDKNMGVRTVQLPAGKDATNITVKTNKDEYKIDTLPLISAGNLNSISAFVMGDYSTDDGEYINEITYESGEFKSGYGTGDYASMQNTHGYIPGIFYGHFLRNTTGSNTKMEVTIEDLSDATILEPQTTTIETPINDATNLSFTSTTSSNVISLNSGDNRKLSTSFSLYRGGGARTTRLEKGFNIYLRENKYLTIDKNTVEMTYNGNDYKVSDGSLIISAGIDNEGNQVYKVSLPNLVLGLSQKYWRGESVKIEYTIAARKTIPTISFYQSELQVIEPMRNISVVPTSNSSHSNAMDKFDVNQNGNTEELLGTINEVAVVNLQAFKDFTVTTAANLNDGPWVSYDYKNETEIINLNPEGKAKYQINVTNNSAFPMTGYTALVPIPKYNEKTPRSPEDPNDFDPSIHLQKDKFGWTTSLLDPVVIPAGDNLNYVVTYSESYDENKDSTNFKPWSQIDNKDDIRMVKIETIDEIPVGYAEDFAFNLSLTDPDADARAGNINIFSARIYREIGPVKGYKPSEPIAIRLKTGVVKGRIFSDKNYNGIYDEQDEMMSNVTIVARDSSTNEILETKQSNATGEFAFMGLDKNQNVNLTVYNPTNDDSLRFAAKTANGSEGESNATFTEAVIKDITPSSPESEGVLQGFIKPHEVTFDATTGGTEVGEAISLRYPSETIAELPTATKKGFTFVQWTNEVGAKVEDGYVVNKSETITAEWNIDQYTLTYDLQGGTAGATGALIQEIDYDTAGAKVAAPTMTGYTFKGWFTEKLGAGTEWKTGVTKISDADQTVYAHFVIDVYNAVFDLNTAKGTAPTKQSVKYQQKVTAPTTVETDLMTKEGHKFLGWSLDKNSTTADYNFVAGMPVGGITLYAIWEANEYKLTYNLQGGAVAQSEQAKLEQTLVFDTAGEAIANPTFTGYVFLGWNTDANAGGASWTPGTSKIPASDTTIYAIWNVDKYDAVFDLNEGTGTAPATQSVPFNGTITKPTAAVEAEIKREGHKLLGWSENKLSATADYDFATLMPAKKVTLYAVWEIQSYKLSFSLNGFEGTLPAAKNIEFGTSATLTALETIGYTFNNWNTKADGTGDKHTGTLIMPARDVVLYAQLDIKSYVATFDLNDANATGTTEPQTVNYKAVIGKSKVTEPKLSLHTFKEWNTKADGSGTAWDLDATKMSAENVTLYAIWSGNGRRIDDVEAKNVNVILDDVSSFTGENLNYIAANYIEENAAGVEVINTPVTDITVFKTEQLKAITDTKIEGIFPLNYKLTYKTDPSDDGVTIYETINIIVTEEPLIIVPGEKVVKILANGFTMTVDQASAATEDDIILKANAKAFEYDEYLTITAENLPISYDMLTKPTTKGIYDATFTAAEAVDKTVDFVVTDEILPPEGTEKDMIDANGFLITLDDILIADEAEMIQRAGAKAVTVDSEGNVIAKNVPVSYDISTKPATIGDHKVTYTTANGATITVDVQVTKEEIPLPPTGDMKEVVTALGFVIPLSDVPAADFVALSDAKGFKINDKGQIVAKDLAVSLTSEKPTTHGETKATFATTNSDPTSVTVLVLNDGLPPFVDPVEVVTANSFTVSLGELATADFVKLADAKGFKISQYGEIIERDLAVSLTSAKPTTVGEFDVVFETTDSLPTTVKVLVTNEKPVNNQVVTATGFAIALKDVEAADFIALAGAKGYDVTIPSKPVSIPVTLKTAKPTEVGVHTVRFETANGGWAEVKVLVTNDDPILPPEGSTEDIVTAENFTIAIASVEAADFVALANAKGFAINHLGEVVKEDIEVTLVGAKPTTVGTHDVSFKTAISEITTIKVLVTNEDPVNNETVTAHGFTVALENIATADFVALAGAIGYDVTDPANPVKIPVTVVSENPTTVGKHTVRFETENGGWAEVTVLVTNEDTQLPPAGSTIEVVIANDFTSPLAEVANADFVALSGAQGFKINDLGEIVAEDLEVSLVTEKPTIAGTFETVFKTDGSDAVAVFAIITQTSDDFTMTANNVTFKQSEAIKLLNDGKLAQEIIDRADAKVVNNINGLEYAGTVMVDLSPLSGKVAPGTYTVALETTINDITPQMRRDARAGDTETIHGAVAVTITADPNTDGGKLPTTGEHIAEKASFGFLSLLLGLFLVSRRRK